MIVNSFNLITADTSLVLDECASWLILKVLFGIHQSFTLLLFIHLLVKHGSCSLGFSLRIMIGPVWLAEAARMIDSLKPLHSTAGVNWWCSFVFQRSPWPFNRWLTSMAHLPQPAQLFLLPPTAWVSPVWPGPSRHLPQWPSPAVQPLWPGQTSQAWPTPRHHWCLVTERCGHYQPPSWALCLDHSAEKGRLGRGSDHGHSQSYGCHADAGGSHFHHAFRHDRAGAESCGVCVIRSQGSPWGRGGGEEGRSQGRPLGESGFGGTDSRGSGVPVVHCVTLHGTAHYHRSLTSLPL